MKIKRLAALAVSLVTAFNTWIFSADKIERNGVNSSAASKGVYSTAAESGISIPETTVSLNGTLLTSVPELQTVSPNGSLTTKIWNDSNGSYYYSVHKASNGAVGTVIEPSKLGLITSYENLSEGFTADTTSVTKTSLDENYTMPFGKHSQLLNNYNELSFPLVKGDSILTITVRMYNDGMAFRYSLNHGAEVRAEVSEIVFPENGTFWGSMPNDTYEYEIGQFSIGDLTSYQFDCSIPLTGHISEKYWVLVSEANVFNTPDPYCAGYLKTEKGSRALTWRFGNKVNTVRMNSAFSTPWRAAVIADNLDEMACSDMILDLNPPSVIKDTSWIRPGKVAWSWWSSGGDSPIEYHMQKDYIDFAAENGWDYVCLDFGWALWDNSPQKVRELCEYGASKDIGIYLWYGVNNVGHYGYTDSSGNHAYPYYSLLDEATIRREFERIRGLGVKGVKVDYYESDTQETMRQMYLCMDIAAENQLMVLFHGCTMPHGESRTYPNVVSYEAVYGTEYYKWRDTPSLTNRINYPFNRNVVGSADFTPTGTQIDGINATAGFALSDVVTLESGVQHFAQSVYTYEGSSALPLLNDVPVAWDDMKVLDGYPMQFSVIGRKSGDDWYIGAATIQSRTISIKLSDIINDNETYTAYIFGDNSDGSDIEVKTLSGLTKESVIEHQLLPNGGCVIKLTKGGMKLTTSYLNYQFYEAESAQLSGIAAVTPGKYCSGNTYVGYVGGDRNNFVNFTNVTAKKSGEYTLRIYYISGEPRSLKIDVNGAYAATLDGLYANKNDWVGIAAVNTTVYLNEGVNAIKLYNDSAFAPSIDRIAIVNTSDETIGDVNADGEFTIADLVMMQRFWLGKGGLTDWKAGDLYVDDRIDVFDMVMMRKLILK